MASRLFSGLAFKDTAEGRAYYPDRHRGPGYLVDPQQEEKIKARLQLWYSALIAVLLAAPVSQATLGVVATVCLVVPVFGLCAWRLRLERRRIAGQMGLRPARETLSKADMLRTHARLLSKGQISFGLVVSGLMFVFALLFLAIALGSRHLPSVVLFAVFSAFAGYGVVKFSTLLRLKRAEALVR